MQQKFPNIKVQPLLIANNDVSPESIEFHKKIEGVDKIDLPDDYLDFIGQFGEGVIGDNIKLYPLTRLIAATKFWRTDNPTKAEIIFFKKHNRTDCTLIGDVGGDTLIYLDGIYYFSIREFEDKIYILGKTLYEVLLFFKYDTLHGKMDVEKFLPFDSTI